MTLGWRPTLEGYKRRYAAKAAMGTLAFTELEITELAPDAALAFGRWTLTREKDKPAGHAIAPPGSARQTMLYV